MKPPQPYYETTYKHDRRRSRHRCRACWKIVNEGDQVLMMRRKHGTWVLHEECSREFHVSPPYTWKDAFASWGTDHLIQLGYKLSRHPYSSVRSTELNSTHSDPTS